MDSAFSAGKKLLRGSYSQFTPTGKDYFVLNRAYGKTPHPGDIVYFYSGEKGRVAHVGIVEDVKKVNDTYLIHTIEGNTSAVAFERNGGGVARKEYRFTEGEVGGKNRINGFGMPFFSNQTCTAEELIAVARREVGYLEPCLMKKLPMPECPTIQNTVTGMGRTVCIGVSNSSVGVLTWHVSYIKRTASQDG